MAEGKTDLGRPKACDREGGCSVFGGCAVSRAGSFVSVYSALMLEERIPTFRLRKALRMALFSGVVFLRFVGILGWEGYNCFFRFWG